MKTIILALFVLTASFALADNAQETEAYCAYLTAQADAQKVLLRTPAAEGGLMKQPMLSGVPVLFVGATNSVSGDWQSRLVMKAAGKNCDLYRATIDTMQRVQFALPDIQKQTLEFRATLLREAMGDIDRLIADNQKLIEAQTSTVPDMYLFQSAKTRLEVDKSNTDLTVATLYVPTMSTGALRELLAQKQALEVETQKATNRVSNQTNWDVALDAGMYRSVTGPPEQSAYGTFKVTYSFGARARTNAFSRGAEDWGQYRKEQQNDAMKLAEVLRIQIENAIASNQASLTALQQTEAGLDAQLKSIEGVETKDAVSFHNRLLADKISIDVEVGTATYQLSLLKDYLINNF
jgi:hypothetical protein